MGKAGELRSTAAVSQQLKLGLERQELVSRASPRFGHGDAALSMREKEHEPARPIGVCPFARLPLAGLGEELP